MRVWRVNGDCKDKDSFCENLIKVVEDDDYYGFDNAKKGMKNL